MSNKASTVEDTTKAARSAVVAALGSIHKAERQLLGAREALVGALETLERHEKHGDILVDGVKIDFDRQVAGGVKEIRGSTEGVVKELKGKDDTETIKAQLQEAGADVETK